MKSDEIFGLLKIPDEVANKAQIWELNNEIKALNKTIEKLHLKLHRYRKDSENKAIALGRRNLQIEDLHRELFIANQFLDPKYK